MDKEILSEFALPKAELDAPIQTGDLGEICISVEIIGILDDVVLLRKHKKAVIEGNFKPEGAKDMRERILEKQDKQVEKD